MDRRLDRFPRSAGILLHVSSLPSPYGVGSFGKAARQWVDFLREAGQSFWQILPLGPTGLGDSPYQSFSAFAGNPYFIDLDTLCEEGLLDPPDFASLRWGASGNRVDYGAVSRSRESVLRKAFARFSDQSALDGFAALNPWFADYGLYMAIKAARKRSWMEWGEPLRLRLPEPMAQAQSQMAEDIRYHAFVQYQFQRQWQALRAYANAKGIRIIGDIPIYVSLDSADVWANPVFFQLDENARPTEVAGCPPDSFSKYGQLWGNPLYDWASMAKTGYLWWLRRLESSFALYDVLRIDHFRGLESYYAIPYGDTTAKNGHWEPGPGMGFIHAVQQALPEARIIAEDLGFLTPEVRQLLAGSGYPGMKVLQFAFDSREAGGYSPHTYEAHSVVYTGTHDNDTAGGWAKTAPDESVRLAMEYMGIASKSRLPRAMIHLAMQCKSDLAVIPMQDWLGLGSGARMNTPSTVCGNNWRWRLREDALNSRLAGEIARMTVLFERDPGASR